MEDKIKKALALCSCWERGTCEKCPYYDEKDSCYKPLFKDILAVFDEQEQEISEAYAQGYEQAKSDIIELIKSGI